MCTTVEFPLATVERHIRRIKNKLHEQGGNYKGWASQWGTLNSLVWCDMQWITGFRWPSIQTLPCLTLSELSISSKADWYTLFFHWWIYCRDIRTHLWACSFWTCFEQHGAITGNQETILQWIATSTLGDGNHATKSAWASEFSQTGASVVGWRNVRAASITWFRTYFISA